MKTWVKSSILQLTSVARVLALFSRHGQLVQRSYRRRYAPLANFVSKTGASKVLDIGCGLGFLKPLFDKKNICYLGVDESHETIEIARQLYGTESFRNVSFAANLLGEKKFDFAILLTVLDEVTEKEQFLMELYKVLADHGWAYIAFRNSDFPMRKPKAAEVPDMSFREYKKLFEKAGFKVLDQGVFYRPWLTGFSFLGVKNVVYRVISYFLPSSLGYMGFMLIKKRWPNSLNGG